MFFNVALFKEICVKANDIKNVVFIKGISIKSSFFDNAKLFDSHNLSMQNKIIVNSIHPLQTHNERNRKLFEIAEAIIDITGDQTNEK